MRILVFASDYPPYGNTSAIHYFTREWVKQGHEVVVIYDCIRLAPPFCYFANEKERRFSAGKYEEYEIDGVKVIKIPIVRPFPKVLYSSIISRNRALSRLENFLADNKFDVVVSHFCSHHHYLATYAKNKLQCPLVSVFHTCDTLNDAKAKQIINDSTLIAVRSQKIKNYILSISNCTETDVPVILSGIPEEYICPPRQLKKDSVLKLLYVGRLTERKCVDDVIRALSMLPDSVDVALDIIGDGLEREKLEALAIELKLEKKIHFYGELSRIDVSAKMRKADCFVMVSYGETFGLVYLEAMASGCITIGSKGEGIDGVIIDGNNGFLVEPGNPAQLAKTLLKVCTLNNEQKTMILNGAYYTVGEMTDTAVAHKYYVIICDAVSRHKMIEENKKRGTI